MKRRLTASLGALALAAAIPHAALAQDDPWPFEGGEYVEVTGIDIKDGASLKYAQWLAGEWRANSDFAVQQGWLNSYEILYNVHARADEPEIYLIRRFKSFIDNDEGDRRRKVMMERYKRTEETLQKESADRADYRTVLSTVLLRKAEWKN